MSKAEEIVKILKSLMSLTDSPVTRTSLHLCLTTIMQHEIACACDLSEHEEKLCREGHKLYAIKAYRKRNNVGLSIAKEKCDIYMDFLKENICEPA